MARPRAFITGITGMVGSHLTDYLMKDRLARLGHAVSQALDRKRALEDKRLAEQRLLLETYHDALTGLPNRVLFLDRLDRVYRQSRRQPSHLFALLYLNLDAFRVVQDSVGPAAADRLLIEVSHRLLGRVRSVDTLARMEGDEFAFLFDNMKIFLFNEGVDLAQIDTSQEGKVNW